MRVSLEKLCHRHSQIVSLQGILKELLLILDVLLLFMPTINPQIKIVSLQSILRELRFILDVVLFMPTINPKLMF